VPILSLYLQKITLNLIFLNFSENYGRQKICKTTIYLGKFLEKFFCFYLGVFTLVLLVLIYDPRGTIFLGSLVPINYYQFPIPLLLILFQAYALVFYHIVCFTIATATIMYSLNFVPILTRELRLAQLKNHKMSGYLRKPENIRHVYRCLQLLQANIFGVFGPFLVMCNASLMVTTLFCNFVLIKYWNQLQIVSKLQLLSWTIIFMGFWACVLELGRFMFTQGNKVLGSWKRHEYAYSGESKLMKKFTKSCKPIVLSYGKQFVIGRVSVLVFFRGVVRGTFRALLTTKK